MNTKPSLGSLRVRSSCRRSVGNWVCACVFGATAVSGHAQFLQSIAPARTEAIHQTTRSGSDPNRDIKENDALQVGALGTVDSLGRAQLNVIRAFMEFDVPALPLRIKATLRFPSPDALCLRPPCNSRKSPG
jgi:hypothetical protein